MCDCELARKKPKMDAIEEEPQTQMIDVTIVVKDFMQAQAKICDILLALVNRVNELGKTS